MKLVLFRIMNISEDIGIPNLAQVEGTILRGGQPTADGFNWLKANGITRIVKLNLEAEGSDDQAVALGIEVVYCPIDLDQQLVFRPKLETVNKAVDAIQPGTFIHCRHGEDRTGLIVGCYRVDKQGWNKDAALAEMKQRGFHPELLGLSLFWEWGV